MTKFYGVSTGETGQYGIGDIVVGDNWCSEDGELYMEFNDGAPREPVYNIFILNEFDGVEYLDEAVRD